MLLLQANPAFAQLQTYSFTQIDSLQAIEKRSVVIFIHTEWCGYCQAMKNTTFRDKQVQKKLNESFYFVALDAEQKTDIIYKGKRYHYKPRGITTGVHELALEIGAIKGQLIFPLIAIVEENDEVLFKKNSFLSPKDLLQILEKLQ